MILLYYQIIDERMCFKMDEQKATAQNAPQPRPDPYKPNPFLLKKGMPATEADFFAAYGITRKKAGEILMMLQAHIQNQNPAIKISHEATWSKSNLDKLFNFAGHNYLTLIKNISNYTFNTFSPTECINTICREF